MVSALNRSATLADVLEYLIGSENAEIAPDYYDGEDTWFGLSGTYLTAKNGTQIWVLICGFLVFWMHAGFSMLETGSVRHKNAVNILFKNLATVAIGGIMYYLLGYAWAYGIDNLHKPTYRFIGTGNYALSQEEEDIHDNRHFWFFQYAFAATGATIVSGAVAGRINLMAYFLTAVLMTSFTYPVVSHWIWATGGWASAFLTDHIPALFAGSGGCGMIDYAGSGVVHMTGGIAAFWGALVLGPRLGRFEGGEEMKPHNVTMQTLGVFILWFGWFGFNCGSTLSFDGSNASKVAVTTTLAPSAAAITSVILSHFVFGHFDIGFTLNSILAGLVSITAGCSTVPDWAAIIIGIIGCLVYLGASKMMLKLKIDDPVDAFAVHGACGVWGCLAVGIFATTPLILSAYGDCVVTNGNWTLGIQFASQLVAVLAIIAWVTFIMLPFFLALKACNFLRVPAAIEENGLDVSEHGGQAAFVADDEGKPAKTAEPEVQSDAEVPTAVAAN